MSPRLLIHLMLCPFLLALAACEFSRVEDLRAWMNEVQRAAHPTPAKMSPPLEATTVHYEAAGRIDPFDIAKISMSLNLSAGNGVLPDLQRPRESLESYPLDSLRMVGSLRRKGQSVAIIEVNKVLYQIREGDHLGQDQGKVISIRDSEMDIEEIVQETGSIWAKRQVQLSIQEKK